MFSSLIYSILALAASLPATAGSYKKHSHLAKNSVPEVNFAPQAETKATQVDTIVTTFTSFITHASPAVAVTPSANAELAKRAPFSKTTTPKLSSADTATQSSPKPSRPRPRPRPRPNHNHVDTVGDTEGVPTTAEVRAKKLRNFCSRNSAIRTHCTTLDAYVNRCIQTTGFNASTSNYLPPNTPVPNNTTNAPNSQNCTNAASMRLLKQIIDFEPCKSVVNGDKLAAEICKRWTVEAGRCKDQTKRGKCAEHHVRYMLRYFRNFSGISGS